MDHHVTRRDLLRAGGISLVAVPLVSCDLLSTDPTSQRSAGDSGPKGKEAPALAAKVKAGELPPVAKRLPDEPVVVQPNDQAGGYGGDLHMRIAGDSYTNAATVYSDAGYENLVRWDPTFKKIIPNVASSYEVDEESRIYTFKLRPGMRWSDGKPFTADDIVFAVNDVMMDEKIFEVPTFGTMEAELVDEQTVTITFPEPNGTFVNYVATRRGSYLTDFPRHYCEKFLPKHNPDADQAAKDAGFDGWLPFFEDLRDGWSFGVNIDKPTLYAWTLATASDNQTRITVERNPYYWKVDPDGSQLPYLDRIVYDVVIEEEAALVKLLQGDFDIGGAELKDKPVVAKNRERGDYRLHDVVPESMNTACIYLNLTHGDPVKREIFSNKDFRIGLSHAINRKEIIDAVFQRQGEPWQVAPRRESVYFDEEMAQQYTEYDLDKANQALDRAYAEKDDKGVRLGPDGKPIRFTVDVANIIPTWPDALEFVAEYWRKVGVDARINVSNAELVVERGEANKHDASVWAGEGGLDGVVLLNPYNYLPLLNPYSYFGVQWAEWYRSDRKGGEKPPADVLKQMDLYDQVNATADQDEQVRLMKELLAIAKDRFHAIGISMLPEGYGTVANKIGNFAKFTTEGAWVYVSPAPTNMCQLYLKER
jgi:ABC-type transport system substrate-binding protein